MKDNSLDGHRGKVALSDTTRNTSAPQSSISSASSIVKCDLKTPPGTTGTANDGSAATNFDDDYNEWELGIGDLIIDLDADIEKTNGGGPQQGIPTSHHSHHHSHHHHHHHHHHSSNHHQNGTASSSVNPGSGVDSSPSASAPATTFNFLGSSQPPSSNLAAAMSNSKSPRITGNSGSGSGASSVSGTGTTGGSANSSGSGTFEHQATVDKGLKMKIKRKTVGNKYSEAKHEIVQSDTKSATSSSQSSSENSSNSSNNCSSNASGSNSPAASSETPKSKHSSSKGRNSSHREKKEKNRDKDKSSSARNNVVNSNSASVTASDVNGVGVLGVMSPIKITNSGVSLSSPAPPPLSTNSSPLPSNTSVPSPSMSRSVANSPAGLVPQDSAIQQVVTGPAPLIGQQVPSQGPTSSSPPMPNLTLKLESKFTPSPLPAVVIKQEERPSSPPLKKIKLEPTEKSEEVECPGSPESPEMKDTSTCTSVGTITEPDCLGPCEPGTSVMLEGIVWQETEGGVLVVNVTWRGKTYVGTLLDCTKHDWAPPRFCESPTSDVDSKTSKGRGKRGRGGNNSSNDINTFADARNCVQSKLRNGKGRRTTLNSNASSSGFTVPNSPAKSENGSTSSKRKGRPADLEISTPPVDNNNKSSKRSRTQNRSTPTSSAPAEFPQPSSPVLIVCPEPNCNKKYKHINGLRYHQTHAHSASDSSKMDDTTTEDSKDVTNSSDNEESMQESASVSTSPAPSFSNSVPSHPTTEKIMLNDTALSSSSSNMNSLPENDLFNLTTDLSTLASVAISDSKAEQKSSRPVPVPLHPAVPQEMPVVNSDGDDTVPPSGLPVSNPSPTATSVSSSVLPVASLSPSSGTGLSTPVSAVTTSVIQSSSSVDSTPISQAVTVSIPASHVIFNQGLPSSSNATTCYTASSVVCNNSNPLSPSRSSLPPSNVTSTFASISSISSTSATSPSAISAIDKNKIKQERPDKYKPKSPVATPAIRPIVPAPTPLHTLPGTVPGSHNAMGLNNHGVIGSPLKPIQPKPTTLGEPTVVNPALEGLKKEKSKHKKKSKDKDRDKKLPPLPLTPTKLNMNSNEECEAIELTSYPSLEAVSEPTLPLSGTAHNALSSPLVAAKPPDAAMEIGIPDDSINENIQSPAYSDISDANDTAPVLESEVPAGKEKEDKVGKTTPDASQSPAANISAYGMYPYYSQPPYLIPSVSPQSAVSGSQGPPVVEKSEISKKTEQERVKESRPWSNPSGESRERPHIEHHESEKKPREESAPIPNAIPSPAAPGGPVQDYPIQQHYPYPYGYVQGYPYPIEPSSYHMHMLESDPHYKQQYKQYIEEQQRLYKEQQHHHQQQQLQQQLHHQQHQSQHHGHQSHHSQHQSHHQSKSQHHATVKEERDRSRESKDKSGNLDKMSNSGLIVEHSSKIQHSSMSLVSNKEHEVREIDSRPPSLPAQARLESSNSASVAALKEKQNENHQILKENIELKSQMDDNKNKMNQYAMLFEMQREDMRRYYMYQDRVIEQQQQKLEPGIHHHTHHHQTIQPHGHLQAPSASYSSSSSLKPHKEDHSSSIPSHSKSSHYGENSRSSTISPAKSDHVKNPHSNSTSSPKGSIRDSSLGSSKDYMSSASSRENTSSKKDSQSKSSERSESSGREDKKGDKIKVEPKVESEGQKPTMETTGPPPPPTNSYAYLHPSYLQPTATHFPHMPFEPPHAMYRGGINPMLVSSPHYGGSPYVHPQIRYVTPGACELPAHSQPPESLGSKLHPSGPPKALDLLHQVSQHYTTTHKIHELQEHAMMSPTPTSTPSSTPSTVSSSSSGKSSSSEPAVAVAKMDVGGSRDASRSPPTQRHLHTHHHTHVGVTYPIYDPYGVTAQKSYT